MSDAPAAAPAQGPADDDDLLIDHHCHSVTVRDLTDDELDGFLSESGRPGAAGRPNSDGALGLAVRRWCAPVLDLEPGATMGVYAARRRELGGGEVTRRLLGVAGLTALLVDTGYGPADLLGIEDLGAVAGAPVGEVVRLEAVAEQLALVAARRPPGRRATWWVDALDREIGRCLDPERDGPLVVGLKSVVAYRYGLDIDLTAPGRGEVVAAAADWLRGVAASFDEGDDPPIPRLSDPTLLRHLLWSGVRSGLPLQLHTGFGDTDIDLHRADPSLLTPFLRATAAMGAPIVLLHCWPFHRHAAYLANVFPHVHLDVGLAIPHVGHASATILRETLELAPFSKVLFASDGFGVAELHHLGATLFRVAVDSVLPDLARAGAIGDVETAGVRAALFAGNARRVYGLAGTGPNPSPR